MIRLDFHAYSVSGVHLSNKYRIRLFSYLLASSFLLILITCILVPNFGYPCVHVSVQFTPSLLYVFLLSVEGLLPRIWHGLKCFGCRDELKSSSPILEPSSVQPPSQALSVGAWLVVCDQAPACEAPGVLSKRCRLKRESRALMHSKETKHCFFVFRFCVDRPHAKKMEKTLEL